MAGVGVLQAVAYLVDIHIEISMFAQKAQVHPCHATGPDCLTLISDGGSSQATAVTVIMSYWLVVLELLPVIGRDWPRLAAIDPAGLFPWQGDPFRVRIVPELGSGEKSTGAKA
ncbi:hypothetical protein E4U43_002312 [Claviceps pusilla]|uniref:Uncharacterized protein n=1 Tax=Claviceps pusilla TaxID=123648 RepID=A0A9P7NGT1_9HYPO|nr:hypothetical protein E4U43_002312 [Claviceps pusilla]